MKPTILFKRLITVLTIVLLGFALLLLSISRGHNLVAQVTSADSDTKVSHQAIHPQNILGKDVFYVGNQLQTPDRNEPSQTTRLIVLLESPSLSAWLVQQRSLQSLKASERNTAIQSYKATLLQEQSSLVQQFREQGLDVTLRRQFTHLINGLAIEVPPGEEIRIQAHQQVREVFPDRTLRVDRMTSVPLVGAPEVWTMEDSSGNPVTGQGLTIAILDTGIDYTHPDLGGCLGSGCKVMGGHDFVNEDTDPMDDHSHGTHVAGIAAGDGAVKGVAPQASLMAIKVCAAGGDCQDSDIIAGLEYAVDPDGDPLTPDQADVINMSLSGPGSPDDPLAQASDGAVLRGVSVVASAGNSGDYRTLGTPGGAAHVLAVGATDNSDALAYFSSRGPCGDLIKPDVVAPGVGISSTIPNLSYSELSGTSMAAPHVAGAAVLVRQMHPNWSPLQVKAALINTAQWLSDDPLAYGTGRLAIERAVSPTELVYPASLSLGPVDTSVAVWTTSRTISVTNLLSMTRDFSLTVKADMPAGVTITLESSVLTIPPGATLSMPITVSVDNELVPYPDNVTKAYFSHLIIENEYQHQRVHLPLAFMKYARLHLQFSETPDQINIHNRQPNGDRYWYGEPVLDLIVPVSPGTYDVIAYYDEPSQDPSALIVKEGISAPNEQAAQISRSEAIHQLAVKLALDDGLGTSINFAHPDGAASLVHRPSGASFSFLGWIGMKDGTILFSDLGQDYVYEANVLFPYEGDVYDLYYRTIGLYQSVTLTNHLQDLVTFPFIVDPLTPDRPLCWTYYVLPNRLNHFELFWGGIARAYGRIEPGVPKVIRMARRSLDSYFPFRAFDTYVAADCWDFERFPESMSPMLLFNQQDEIVAYDAGNYTTLYTVPVQTYRMNLSPVFWSGEFEYQAQKYVKISGGQDGYLTAFLKDQWRNDLALPLPYTLTVQESVVAQGDLIKEVENAFWRSALLDGEITFHTVYTFPLDHTISVGNVWAYFDSSRADPDPPTLVSVQVLENGTPTFIIEDNGEILISLSDASALMSPTLEIDINNAGWQTLDLQRDGDVFRADLPSFLPNSRASLRITAQDFYSNTLVNHISPALLGKNTIYVYLPLVLKQER